jgi:hypothetical protein
MQCLSGNEILNTENENIEHEVLHTELPRRSLRKLAILEEPTKTDKCDKFNKLTNFSNNIEKISQQDLKPYSKSCSRISKTKRHKNKARHHKEKRKKRKHQKIKNLKDLVPIGNRIKNDKSWELDLENNVDKSSSLEKTTYLQSMEKNSNSLNLNQKLRLQTCNNDVSQKICSDINKTDVSIDQNFANTKYCKQVELNLIENISSQSLKTENNLEGSRKYQVCSIESSQSSINSAKLPGYHKDIENAQKSNIEKPNKKRRSKQEFHESHSMIELSEAYSDEIMIVQKRDKKRNKGDQIKRHRDVRKAPQDGIIITDDYQESISCSKDALPITAIDTILSNNSTLISEKKEENESIETEPPRLAIKIKLCQECNSRHLQDACPLLEPKYTIKDSISLEQWIKQYNNKLEVMNAFNSNNPMSQGYSKCVDDDFDSEEELSEKYKSKTKRDYEKKQQTIDENKPLYARDSLPECLEIKLSNMDHGLGVFVKSLVPMYAQLGPLIGKPVQEMDIPDDFSMKHIWEV